MRVPGIAIAIAVLLPGAPATGHSVQRLMDVREVATDTLRDVALVAPVQGRPTIYYNPVLLERLGPELSAFFLAHEYGHIHNGHTGGALLDEGELDQLRQQQELEADCYAARHLAGRNPAAVDAALRFFLRLGSRRFDAYHPTGSQRAAGILSCLPQHEAQDGDAGW